MAASLQQQSPTFWEKTKNLSGSAYNNALKPGFNKVYATVDKLGPHVNRLANKVGSEAFWPTTLDIESEKAARILRSFCKDGLYEDIETAEAQRVTDKAEKERTNKTGFVPKGKQKVIKKIPAKAIQNAKALVIFTTMRTAWIIGGAGGAGVIVARHPETGEWSPPSGIHMQNFSVGFMGGVDIIDTVLVINSYKALEAFTKIRCTLGSEVALTAGPYGVGGTIDTKITEAPSPVWAYVKTRGAFAGIGIDGNIVIERTDENARFYAQDDIKVADILQGKVRHPPYEQYKVLIDTIRAAQGEAVDESLLPDGITPSDMELPSTPGTTFGVPAEDDPDPYGFKALEAEGLTIREAGTHRKASAEAFEFRPSPSSPIYPSYRKSIDVALQRREWRGSQHSFSSHHSVDRGTQTNEDDRKSPNGVDSPQRTASRGTSSPMRESYRADSAKSSPRLNGIPEHKPSIESSRHSEDSHDEYSDVDSDVEISTAEAAIARPKAGVVTVPKRVAPALPPRNPSRVSNSTLARSTTDTLVPSDEFERVSLHEDNMYDTIQETPTVEKQEHDVVDTTEHLALSVGVHNTEDQFHSIPPTPSDEEEKHHELSVVGKSE